MKDALIHQSLNKPSRLFDKYSPKVDTYKYSLESPFSPNTNISNPPTGLYDPYGDKSKNMQPTRKAAKAKGFLTLTQSAKQINQQQRDESLENKTDSLYVA